MRNGNEYECERRPSNSNRLWVIIFRGVFSNLVISSKLCLFITATIAPIRTRESVSQKGFSFFLLYMYIAGFFCERTFSGFLVSLITEMRKNSHSLLLINPNMIARSCHLFSSCSSISNQLRSQEKCSFSYVKGSRIRKSWIDQPSSGLYRISKPPRLYQGVSSVSSSVSSISPSNSLKSIWNSFFFCKMTATCIN